MTTQTKKSSKVLMYSGGMDSFIISRNFDFDKIVFAVLGNEDNTRELERAKADPFINKRLMVVNLPMAQFELDNKIIPYRNHALALLGAQFGSEIYFGFTGGDTTKDKDFVFKSQMEGILNYFALDQHKVNHQYYPYSVEMPYKEFSKGQMVAEYIRKGNTPSDLWTISRSCYDGDVLECGVCRSCLRKYVALAVNGLQDAHTCFAYDPRPELRMFLDECRAKGRFQTEIDEIKAAINGEVLYKAPDSGVVA